MKESYLRAGGLNKPRLSSDAWLEIGFSVTAPSPASGKNLSSGLACPQWQTGWRTLEGRLIFHVEIFTSTKLHQAITAHWTPQIDLRTADFLTRLNPGLKRETTIALILASYNHASLHFQHNAIGMLVNVRKFIEFSLARPVL